MPAAAMTTPMRWLQRLVVIEPAELGALLWSFAYFFLLLCSYYILRPLRDEMGIAGGVKNLPWVFTGTFVVMLAAVPLFGWCAARFPRRTLLPVVYGFFTANLLLFYLLFQIDGHQALTARAFFIWTSVFNLFVVSVFWSFMVDLYSNAQARRLFGFIAAGGSAGALTGPLVTALLVGPLGPVNLLPVSALLLLGAMFCIRRLVRWARQQDAAPAATPEQPLGGSVWAGLGLVARTPYPAPHRAGSSAVMRPARELLFTVVGRETKYKAKNFIDTVVYRGGDAISGWIFAGLKALGLGVTGIAVVAGPGALAWAGIGYALGRRQEVLRARAATAAEEGQ